ncbi:hypothetical protein, partial [Helicobacter sp. TUL]|uniref:hypothetical protein n=1 Tax=Helicobacter sp. TUL TaxID=1848928 RepID=UPI0021510F3C
HNTQGQPIIYLLNCENRKTYQIALQANTDTNGNIIQDKAGNTSYNAILSTELDLDMKATTKLILSCHDLVAQNYSTYDIHKITGVGIVSVNYDLKQKAKKGESIIYKNVLQLKQTTTLDEMITNTDSILEVRINNTQKPLKIDTTLECEAIYYGYNLIQWAYMILPTKEYNPNKTKLQKDIDYYELPSDTYKGNIISFNPKEYLQSKDNAQAHQSSNTHISQTNNTQESITTPNSQNANNNISNTTQTNTNTQITQQTHQSTQLAKLLSGEYTLILFAYQKTPAYHTTHYIQDVTTNQRLARQAITHTKLDYNPPLSLRFNGKELQILEWGEVTHRFKAQSGILENTDNNLASNTQTNTQDSTNNYSQNKDCIESGIYYVKNIHLPKETRFIDGFFTNSWNLGDKYFQLYQTKDSTKPINDDFITTTHYTIHGGSSYGDIKGVDLAAESKQFFNAMQALYKKYKNELESMGNVIKLEVGYGTGEMVLEVVRKWEYSPNNADFQYWATISEFSLKLDGEIVKDSKNQEIKGYIIEPAGMNPEINKTAEEQQKTAGGDIRIPAGEYEVFWKKSDISKPALMIENPKNKEIYLNDLQDTIRNLDMNIEQLFCNVVVCKHNKNDRKTFGTKHIHIVPQLKPKNTNTTIIGKSRDGILIHYGDTGEWSTGCLLPTNELRWKKERWIAKDRDSTINAIARLYIAIIKHDSEAFKHYALGANNFTKSTIKKFIVKITEHDKIESYPPLKEK